jgi:hypothetical protein
MSRDAVPFPHEIPGSAEGGGAPTGIAAENAGTPVAGGPFSIVNAQGALAASNGGGGILNLSASAGVAAENAGTPVSGGPFTTINAEGALTASSGGSGVLNLSASGAGNLVSILQNRAQHLVTTNQIGVVGGGNIVPPVTLTMVASGKLRVTVNGSFQTNGSVNAIISVEVNGGAKSTVWSFQEQTGNISVAANVTQATTFELDTAATPGQTVEVFYTSTTGDHALSEFVLGVGDACSGILLEELP